ncbi:hypothetical protein NW757_003080 [Fusarium falciforme]|nr:hypothetical protein NW757_003080 [Fusarium falciforme]
MSLQVSTGAGSLIALGLAINDVATLVTLSRQVVTWLSTESGDKDLLDLLDHDEMDVLWRGGLIDTTRFNKRWGSDLVLLVNCQSQAFTGEKAENALETLGQLSAIMVCIVAASIEDPELEAEMINAFTVLQAFFMGYYYGILLSLVDTSMRGLPVVEGVTLAILPVAFLAAVALRQKDDADI